MTVSSFGLLNVREKLSVPRQHDPVLSRAPFDFVDGELEVNGRHDAIAKLLMDHR